MKFVPHDDMPWRDITVLGFIFRDILELAQLHSVEPTLLIDDLEDREEDDYYLMDGQEPSKWYSLSLILSSGAVARMSQDVDDKKRIELQLEIVEDNFVYQDDFDEIVHKFQLAPGSYYQFDNGFTWLPNRSAPKIKRKLPVITKADVIKTVYKGDLAKFIK